MIVTIAARLRDSRKKYGVKTAKEFAIRNNIPVSTYAMHETGRRGLRLNVAQKYCNLLNINITWLLTGKHT